MLSDQKIQVLLSRLAEIEHVEFVRIGSRIPVFLPQRITPSLLDAFQFHPNLWLSIHVNHPLECTDALRNACHQLAKAGIPLGNQSVLLKQINDDKKVMKSLIHRLLMMKVKPYYLYQCDLVKGSSHFRVDPVVGIDIIESLNGTIDEVIISDLKDNTYFAEIVILGDQGKVSLSSRPSDAIALALRTDTTISVNGDLFLNNSIDLIHDKTNEIEEFKSFLENIEPEDFV